MVMVGDENEHVHYNSNISSNNGTNDEEGTASILERTGHLLPSIDGIEFVDYVDEGQLEDVMRLVGQDLSEPYSGEGVSLSINISLLNNREHN